MMAGAGRPGVCPGDDSAHAPLASNACSVPLANWGGTLGSSRVVDPFLPVIVDLASLCTRRPQPGQDPAPQHRQGWPVAEGYASAELRAWSHS